LWMNRCINLCDSARLEQRKSPDTLVRDGAPMLPTH
jgi:hypothetical protein